MSVPGTNRRKDSFEELIAKKELRKLREKKRPANAFSGFKVFGVVGWTIALLTLLGIGAGIWLDKTQPQRFSWTLTGLLAGLTMGSIIAFNFLDKENKDISKNDTDHE